MGADLGRRVGRASEGYEQCDQRNMVVPNVGEDDAHKLGRRVYPRGLQARAGLRLRTAPGTAIGQTGPCLPEWSGSVQILRTASGVGRHEPARRAAPFDAS